MNAIFQNHGSIDNDISNNSLLKEYIKDARRQGLTQRTIDNYYSCLHIFFSQIGKNASQIAIDDLRTFLDFLVREKALADPSISRYFSAFQSFYDFLEFEGVIERSIIPIFRKRYLGHLKQGNNNHSKRQLISIQKMAELINAILDPRDKAAVAVLAKTGIRRNELITLDIDDINWEDNSITLKPTRKRHNNIVFFDGETAEALKRWVIARENRVKGKKCDALFVNERGQRLNRNGIYTAITKYAERIGIHNPNSKNPGKRFTTHCCRHWFTTYLLRNGMPREYVKELRGDSRVEAIDIYHHIDRSDLRKSYLACIPELGI